MPLILRQCLFFVLLICLVSLPPSFSQQPQATLGDLPELFTKGVYLQDRNDDGVLDFVNARIVVPEAATPEDIAAAANIAARLGFESSAITPGLGVLDTEISPGPDTPPLILVGHSNRWVRRLQEEQKLDLKPLEPGQGLVAIVGSAFGGAAALVVAGADSAGTLAAANGASARLPYLWQLRHDSVQSVQRDVRSLLSEHGIRVSHSYSPLAVYEGGKEQITNLVVVVELASGADAESAAAVLDEIAAAHVVGRADFTDRKAVRLNYYGLQTLEVRIEEGRSVRIDRFGPPYRSRFPENAWKPPAKLLDLSSLYTVEGLFGDSRGEDKIPDETETVVVIGSEAGAAVGAIDVAARIALETTGVSLPLVKVEAEVTDPSKLPNPIFIGPGKLLGSLSRNIDTAPGEGIVQIVPQAFGASSAVLVTGGDEAGVNAAAMYLAAHVPYLWETRRGEVSFEQIGGDLTAFFRGRSTSGQAARATVELDDVLESLEGKELKSIEAKVYLEEGSPEFGSFLRQLLKERTGAEQVTATATSRYGPVLVFEDKLELDWEVNELRQRFRAEVLPKVSSGDKVGLEVLVSESPEIRRELEQEFQTALGEAGASQSNVRVICAYKQGFSWLADYVLPAIEGKSVGSITVSFPTAHYPSGEKWYGMPIRWLQEIFPIDEIFARELGIDIDATKFEKVDSGPVVYRVEVKDSAGQSIYTDEFAPRFVEREYFSYKPTAKIHYTTGGFLALVNEQQIADVNIRTDPERFWDHYQNTALPRMFEYAQNYTEGNLGLENQPFFRDLIFDITMSEPDFRLNLDEERISSLDSLHEDLTFNTIDFWAMFSGKNSGSREVAPGRIMPMIHPVQPGEAPDVTITFKGNAVPRPRLVVSWHTGTGEEGERTIDLSEVDVDSPRITQVKVKAGADGAARLVASVSGKTFQAAETAAQMVEALGRIQSAGALKQALGYARLDELVISAESGSAAMERTLSPVDRSLLPKPGDFQVIQPEAGKRIVTWDHVIGPDELEQEIIPRLRTFPEINAYVSGRTYRGRNSWAMDVMLPMDAALWSQAKASALKPVLFLTTRQHSNEVSATSAALRLMELFATDPEYGKYLNRINIVYNPMENPDGAANHQEFYKLQPTYILHGGYWSSVARDVGAYIWDPDPLLPEALVRRKLYYTWLPDVYMNPHGYPSHEWVHQFAGYKVPWFMAFWIPRGYHINLGHIDDQNYPDHKPVGLELRERIIEEVQGVPEIRAANKRLVHRFEKYARNYEPDPFRLEIYKGMNILFDHSYSYREPGDSFSREIYVSSMGSRPNPEGTRRPNFLEKHPQITVLRLGCDMPDETAGPEWMEKVAARGQFGYLMSVVKLLYDSQWEVQRFEEDFRDAVRLSVFRPRPVKASRGGLEVRPTEP